MKVGLGVGDPSLLQTLINLHSPMRQTPTPVFVVIDHQAKVAVSKLSLFIGSIRPRCVESLPLTSFIGSRIGYVVYYPKIR